MLHSIFNDLSGKKISHYGSAFKANAGDTRETPAIFVVKRLLEEQAEVVITDPKALKNARADLEVVDAEITYTKDPYEAASRCHAIPIMTEWELYKNLDYGKIFHSMAKPDFIFDARNILDHEELSEIDFSIFPIGKPS
jgi:UDPglucose 6-dehydrogenase